jgi:cysteine desulfurase/selenocysteine lyase
MLTTKNDALATGFNQSLAIKTIRDDFPMLHQRTDGKLLVYLDSAATSHKPRQMMDKLVEGYSTQYGKIRESTTYSRKMTDAYEEARQKVATMMNAADPNEIVFVKNCTEAINIVANGFERAMLKPGDEILITQLEHHANIIPWQLACLTTGAELKVAPINRDGELDLEQFEQLLTDRTRIVSISHSSNVLGTISPVRQVADIAHARGIPVLVDGAQMAPHSPVDMQALDCDFYTFSAHKMGGPSGVGVLYGRKEWLDKLPPHHGGSEMVNEVTFAQSTYLDVPLKFEAGTPAFVDVIAFGTVVDYLQGLGRQALADYEQELLTYATERMSTIDRVRTFGNAPEKEPVISFDVQGLDVKALETYFNDDLNLEVRAGQLSAQPLMNFLGVSGLLRASFCFYNTRDEIDFFADSLEDYIRKKG